MVVPSDLIGVAVVYIYVAILLIFTEKYLSKNYPVMSRKFLHIMTGNIAFLLPLFHTRWIMVFVAAGPFIVFTFLMSAYSPIKSMRGTTSEAGHDMGLVYYAISWTVLAYFFFQSQEIIAIGILAMSYGDGFASVIGIRFAKKKYQIFDDTKSYLGTFAMFVFTLIMLIVCLLYYGGLGLSPTTPSLNSDTLLFLTCISAVAAIAEAVTPKGLDNLSVPFLTAALCWLTLVVH